VYYKEEIDEKYYVITEKKSWAVAHVTNVANNVKKTIAV